MDSANYGIKAKYDQNTSPEQKIERTLNSLAEVVTDIRTKKPINIKMDAVLVEHIILDGLYKINLYCKHEDATEYIKTDSYFFPLKDYEEIRLEDILDVSKFFPVKNLVIEQMPHNLLGYTAIGAKNIFRNARLIPGSERAYEVDVHETIHTEDEHETRVLTSWILDKNIKKYLFRKGIMFNGYKGKD